jgi:hypothetical protein
MPQSATLLWYLFQVASHAIQPSPPGIIPAKDIGSEYVQPQEAGPATFGGVHFEYVATRERETHIIDGDLKLEAGPSRAEVRKLLGPPDISRPVYAKDNSTLRYWDYIYRIRYHEKTRWTEGDSAIELFFTSTGKLDWARVHEIPSLSNYEVIHRMGGKRVGNGIAPGFYRTVDFSSSR